MQTPDQLTNELRSASKSLERCLCGSAVIMAYTPGCTFIHCFKEGRSVAALPDWQPEELAQEWNEK